MTLQTQRLCMAGLSIEGNVPPNTLQPQLEDGIHLRWSFERELGFPWYGYYLFRRPSNSADRTLRKLDTSGLRPGSLGTSIFDAAQGQVSSDTTLVATDDFPQTGVAEFDLSSRGYLRFIPLDLASSVEIEIGFRQDAEITITAYSAQTPVASRRVGGHAGNVEKIDDLKSDAITSVEFSPGPAAVSSLGFLSATDQPLAGWLPVPGFPGTPSGSPYPLCLPIAHQDYTCPGAPANVSEARNMAIDRVRYGFPDGWTSASFSELQDVLGSLVVSGPGGPAMASKRRSVSPLPPDPRLKMPKQSPLDMLMLGALHPGLAQMLGLYWVDESANLLPSVSYDYMIVADHRGVLGGTAQGALNFLRSQVEPFRRFDAFIVYDQTWPAPQTALEPPSGVRSFALPGGTMTRPGSASADASAAGLRWDRAVHQSGTLLPGKPVLYHVWRADLGTGAAPATPSSYAHRTTDGPVLVVDPVGGSAAAKPPADWPPYRLHYIDGALAEGWYGYQVSGVDIFGRHSANSGPAPWYQWTPAPSPLPWYYKSPPGETQVHPSAVGLLDKIPPPPPTGVEAYVLDPEDPLLVQDAAYAAWCASLPAIEKDLVGNAATVTGTVVTLDGSPDLSGTGIVGSYLRLEGDTARADKLYRIMAVDDAADKVTLDSAPSLAGASSVWAFRRGSPLFATNADPLRYGAIGVSAADDKKHSIDASKWALGSWGGSQHYGNEGRVGPAVTIYHVYRGKPSVPELPSYTEDSVSATRADYHGHSYFTFRWNKPANDTQTHILRALDDTLFKTDWLLRSTRKSLGPTTESHKPLFPPSWTAAQKQAAAAQLNAITALESYDELSTAARELLARLPGNDGFAWGDGLKERDWEIRRTRTSLSIGDSKYFPSDWTVAGAANAQKRQDVATALNVIASQAAYSSLSNNALRVLASLPGNESAFTQLTIQPLDPSDSDIADRRGPDSPDTYAPSTSLLAYIDTLDGRSASRHFYRALNVNAVHTRGDLGLATPPVYCPDVVPPRTPVITRLIGGDRQVTLGWASNREPDLARYEVYRTGLTENVRDLRLMTLMHTEVVSPGDPALRSAEVIWTDAPVPGLLHYSYRVVAVDTANNISSPSMVAVGRAYDEALPVLPTLAATWVASSGSTRAQITWTSADGSLLQRRSAGGGFWTTVDNWLSPGTHMIVDHGTEPGQSYEYRLRVRKATGAVAVGNPVVLAGGP